MNKSTHTHAHTKQSGKESGKHMLVATQMSNGKLATAPKRRHTTFANKTSTHLGERGGGKGSSKRTNKQWQKRSDRMLECAEWEYEHA